MAKWKYIRNDTYRRGITIFIGSNEEFIDFIKHSPYKNDSELMEQAERTLKTSLAVCYNDSNDGQSLIYFPKWPDTPAMIAALGHEILHAIFFILDFCGVEYSRNSEEAYTYLYEYLLTKALTEKGYKDVE